VCEFFNGIRCCRVQNAIWKGKVSFDDGAEQHTWFLSLSLLESFVGFSGPFKYMGNKEPLFTSRPSKIPVYFYVLKIFF